MLCKRKIIFVLMTLFHYSIRYFVNQKLVLYAECPYEIKNTFFVLQLLGSLKNTMSIILKWNLFYWRCALWVFVMIDNSFKIALCFQTTFPINIQKWKLYLCFNFFLFYQLINHIISWQDSIFNSISKSIWETIDGDATATLF